ncbi:hypothetical protein Nepgr_018050 [Nepenthes gracilis]|uniref:Uncharacterized protein n=1 Tax=Nepenthes gracilis TaxID=150966 RepID=A0AAD3SSR5_NEPGR|nr:hypothetical protein Nepgr_018050 [Nepenthes gracilis]
MNSNRGRKCSFGKKDGRLYIVDEWVKATEEIAICAEGTPDSLNPSFVDEEGFLLPHWRKGVLCDTVSSLHISSMGWMIMEILVTVGNSTRAMKVEEKNHLRLRKMMF